jgi:hypothetical protein
MGQTIRIDDLKHPRLTPEQQAAVDYGESLQVDFSEQGILDAARAKTGLDDFGADDFRARLRLLCDEWGGDPEVNGLHRSILYGYLFRYACNRLLIRDTLKKHPEILQQKIERPIIVLGLPRSGTTHLVNLLAADRRLHSLPLWESYEPMHPMEPEHIHEELELMGPDFASYNFEWLSPSPRWRDHYFATDQTPHYRYMLDVLKLLQWRRGEPGKRWVLKCPQHLEQIPALRSVFPDATFVITHRDPLAVIQSSVTMLAYGERMRRSEVDTDALAEYWTARIEHLLRACVRDRESLPAAQSIDVLFHEFMADDLAMVEKIYAVADMPMTTEARAQFAQFLADHPRGKEGRMVYDLPGDFGVDLAALRARFAFYFERFAVRAEV